MTVGFAQVIEGEACWVKSLAPSSTRRVIRETCQRHHCAHGLWTPRNRCSTSPWATTTRFALPAKRPAPSGACRGWGAGAAAGHERLARRPVWRGALDDTFIFPRALLKVPSKTAAGDNRACQTVAGTQELRPCSARHLVFRHSLATWRE